MTKRGMSSKLPKNISDDKVQKLLLENFIVLQKVMTDMSVKFDRLSDHMSKLLALFESSAKSFSEKQPVVTKEDKDFLEKLDRLLEQNKLIAKGLTMIDERAKEKISPQQFQPQPPQQQTNNPPQGYQIPKSMSNFQQTPQQFQQNHQQQNQQQKSQYSESLLSDQSDVQKDPSNKKSRLLPRF